MQYKANAMRMNFLNYSTYINPELTPTSKPFVNQSGDSKKDVGCSDTSGDESTSSNTGL